MLSRPSILMHYLTALVVKIVLALVGFAHKTTQTNLSPEMAAFVSAGGSLTDLCGDIGGTEQTGYSDCEACRIADSMIQLRCVDSADYVTLQKTLTFAFVAKRLSQSRGLDPARLTRAPPQT